jgi:peptide deformylase
MALREIRLIPDEILKQRAKPINKITPKVHQLLDDMKETLISKDGIGIAAPQVGVLRTIIIVMVEDTYIELINPKIVETRGLVIGMEACLSIPDEVGYVRRPHYVKIEGLDRDGEEVTYEATGLTAVAICHEMDHLIGVLFTDRQVTPTPREQQMLDEAEARRNSKNDEIPDPTILNEE